MAKRQRGTVTKFLICDAFTKVVESSPRARAIIFDLCRARPDGYHWMPRYKSRQWDGYISLLKSGNLFPTGLLRSIANALEEAGIKCLYSTSYRNNDRPIKVMRWPDIDVVRNCLADGTVLRDYQLDAVLELLDHDRGIAKMATNAGKTVVFAALIKMLDTIPTTVIVQSLDLLYQTSKRLAQMIGCTVGIIGDGKHSKGIVRVATIQTLNSMHKRIGKAAFKRSFYDNDILIVDECHHVGHNKAFDVLLSMPGWYRFGFSGTPLDRDKLSDLKLIACTGPVQVTVTNKQLIIDGWSAVPLVYVHEYKELLTYHDGTAVEDDDYDGLIYATAYKEHISLNPHRNATVVDIASGAQRSDKSVLIIVRFIDHGRRLTASLVKDGVLARFVCGGSPIAERQQALNILASGQSEVIVATNIFDEGVDVPALDVVILACGGKSHIKLLQRMGRGLRAKKGKDNIVEIHDFADVDNKYLERHYDGRIKVYEQEGFEVNHVALK